VTRDAPRYEGFLPGLHPIDSFGRGGFRFAGMSHVGSLLALPSGMRAVDPPQPFRHNEALYAPVFEEAEAIDILLLGVGTVPLPVPQPLRQRLRDAAISADVMTTASAASTYNLLLGEGRRVAALLIAVP
jgi:uncharacterized protein